MNTEIICTQNLATKINGYDTRVLGSAGGVVERKVQMHKDMVGFEDASILFTPNGYRGSRLQNVIPDTAGGDFTFSRASGALRINSSGVEEVVGNNIPRIDFRTGRNAYLNETQATNLFLNSAVGVTQDCATILDVVSRPHWLSFEGTGSITVSGSGTLTLNGTGVNDRVSAFVMCSTGTATLTVTGTVTRVQFERNFYPTSYIATTGSTSTRVTENANVNNVASLIGQDSGTIFIDFDYSTTYNDIRANKSFFTLNSGNMNNYLSLNIANQLGVDKIILTHRKDSSGVQSVNADPPILGSFGRKKVIIKYENLNTAISIKIFLNGGLVQTISTSLNITATLQRLYIGGEGAFLSATNEAIYKAAHWNYALSDNKCLRLTI
jgi:hypothetical protein